MGSSFGFPLQQLIAKVSALTYFYQLSLPSKRYTGHTESSTQHATLYYQRRQKNCEA
jgi:hypothetical protein